MVLDFETIMQTRESSFKFWIICLEKFMCYYAHKSPLQVISALWLAFKIVFARVVLFNFQTFWEVNVR